MFARANIVTDLNFHLPVLRILRPLFAFFLSLLLVITALEAQVHALEHVRDMLAHTPDHSLVSPSDEACAVCALFAGGANGLAGTADVIAVTFATHERLQSAPVSVTPAFSSYYQSRAPPSLL